MWGIDDWQPKTWFLWKLSGMGNNTTLIKMAITCQREHNEQ
jgi:hypothetical protein